MSTKPDGGPVHPVRLPIPGALHACDEPAPTELHPGMTLRDYFAAKAMQALIAASRNQDGAIDYIEVIVSASAYAMADAMLEARKC